MDFELNSDEEALVEAMSSFCAGKFPMATVRSLADTGGIERALWSQLAETGVFNLRVEDSKGGAGMGMTEAVLVFEELGKALVPGPLVATHCAAGLTSPQAAEIAAGAADGTSVVGLVELGRFPNIVEHLSALDVLLIAGPEGIDAVDPTNLEARELAIPFDPLTPVWSVENLDVASIAGAVRVCDSKQAEDFLTEARALSSALLIGIAQAVVWLAVDYSKQRYQFDRPIGSFQAVKHILADALTRAEVARASVHAAGVTIDDPSCGDVARAVAGAKLLAGETAISNSRACIQVHGGMGFTWEVDAHLYMKRATVLGTSLGTADEMAFALAEAI